MPEYTRKTARYYVRAMIVYFHTRLTQEAGSLQACPTRSLELVALETLPPPYDTITL